MSLVKSFACGDGDMHYIQHNSDNFTMIDCLLTDERKGSILSEIKVQSKDKGIFRFISTHPDQDHICGLVDLDDEFGIRNFYVVKNSATKSSPTSDFTRYRELRDDSKKAFYLRQGCSRKWMNQSDEARGSSGLNCLWPILEDDDYKAALADAAKGLSTNNISCIMRYATQDGVSFLWMGDLETDFMEKLTDKIDMRKTTVLFAPHHGRDSGEVPIAWLDQMSPSLVVIGEAPSEYLDYYSGYDIITQNSCGDALFQCSDEWAHVYVGDAAYTPPALTDKGKDHAHGLYYVGSISA